jgi:DNA end-binding protein Ku
MASRPIWTGAISFGLVNVPVRLYSATQQKDVRFHEFDQRTGKRIRHKRVTEGSNREIDYDDVAKGYEVSKGKYVVLERGELEAADPDKTRTIEISEFVELAEIDPIFYEKSYYLGPEKDKGAKRAYALLLRALEEADQVAIARFVMRSKEYLAAVRAGDGVLVLETLFFPDEIRDAKSTVSGLPLNVRAESRDLDMAKRLVNGLTAAWKPEKYKDRYRQRVLSLIKRKQQGKEIVAERTEAPEPPADLMEALRASVEGMKKRGSKRGSTTRSRRSRKAS